MLAVNENQEVAYVPSLVVNVIVGFKCERWNEV
jgi:hypothetical protein